jgi:A/G-specific adenine glycosylase
MKILMKKLTNDLFFTKFPTDLLNWYQANARDLPWRRAKDPYAIWVSEVMLQQTRVETVIPYYQRFLARFPTIVSLAEAPEQEVLKLWEGLGYYRRVKLLQRGAQEVMERFEGKLPADPDELASVSGVGPYMRGALASIAFNLPVPAIDGNVNRVVTRILAWEAPVESAGSRQTIYGWVLERFPKNEAGTFAQAMMELGALVCLPRGPRCEVCPVREYCRGKDARPEGFPVKKAAREVPVEERVALRIRWNGRRLLIQRPESGMLAGLWEYPNLAVKDRGQGEQAAREWAKKHLGVELEFRFLTAMTETFTHRRWELTIWEAEWKSEEAPLEIPRSGWLLPEEEAKLPRVAFVRRLVEMERKTMKQLKMF